MYEDAIEQMNKIESYVTGEETRLLYESAKRAKKGIVEIGSWKGRSSVALAQGSRDGNKVPVYCVDTWKNCDMYGGDFYQEFHANTINYRDVIVPKIGWSDEIAKDFNEEFDLLFIDGCHSPEVVFWDWGIWAMKMKGGEVYLHDVRDWPGPIVLFDMIGLHGYKTEKFGNIGRVIIGDGIKDSD